jgi:hypothetical protein
MNAGTLDTHLKRRLWLGDFELADLFRFGLVLVNGEPASSRYRIVCIGDVVSTLGETFVVEWF